MIELFTDLAIVAGGLAALGFIWTQGVKRLYRAIRRMEDVHDYILVELPAWQKTVDNSMKELSPNSGSSIHDKINCTKNTVEDVRELLIAHLGDLTAHNTSETPRT
jgi:hypothetical protein